MSIPFSDVAGRTGIIQLIEDNCGFPAGGISGNATLLANFTRDINLAIDEVFGFMFPLGGTWQLDDNNHTKYPIIYTNVVSGQRDYNFTTDQQGNQILDIHRVILANSAGIFSDITPVDQQTANNSQSDTSSFIDGRNTTGTPTRYDKTGLGIFLDPIPNYNYTNGLGIFINREASYFVVGDTTKKVGFASLFHEYFALKPSYRYARDKSLKNKGDLNKDYLAMQAAIKLYFGKRQKDVKGNMRPAFQNNK